METMITVTSITFQTVWKYSQPSWLEMFTSVHNLTIYSLAIRKISFALSRPRLRSYDYWDTDWDWSPVILMCWDQNQDYRNLSCYVKTKTETRIFWVSISKPILKFFRSQYWDWDQGKKCCWVSVSRPRLRLWNIQDWEVLLMSRRRLMETRTFYRPHDQDSLTL